MRWPARTQSTRKCNRAPIKQNECRRFCGVVDIVVGPQAQGCKPDLRFACITIGLGLELKPSDAASTSQGSTDDHRNLRVPKLFYLSCMREYASRECTGSNALHVADPTLVLISRPDVKNRRASGDEIAIDDWCRTVAQGDVVNLASVLASQIAGVPAVVDADEFEVFPRHHGVGDCDVCSCSAADDEARLCGDRRQRYHNRA